MNKEIFYASALAVGSAISAYFGEWTTAIQTLLILMGADYLTGMIVAGVFHKSSKSDDGGLESFAGWKGLMRKGVQLLVVLVGAQLDALLGTGFVRDGIIIAFCLNETLSVVENAGLMGIPIPKVISQAITVLKQRAGEEKE